MSKTIIVLICIIREIKRHDEMRTNERLKRRGDNMKKEHLKQD